MEIKDKIMIFVLLILLINTVYYIVSDINKQIIIENAINLEYKNKEKDIIQYLDIIYENCNSLQFGKFQHFHKKTGYYLFKSYIEDNTQKYCNIPLNVCLSDNWENYCKKLGDD